MANNVTDLGKVGITMKGEWSSSTAYERLDSVMYDGSLWIALADNTNSTPTINNSNWMLSAKHGEFTEQQLEDFKAEVVAESKEEMDEYTSEKKDELDTYTSGLESDFNTNASSKTTDFNNNATSKTGDFDSNASSKTTAFNTNASDKTTAFNSNATSKTSDFNDNASSKTNAFNSNATEKTTAFDNNASAKTTAFNENATSKTTDFNTNATSKTGDFNDNATAKTTAFDEHFDDKIDEFDENAESLQQEIDELSANMPWAETEQATSIDITDAAKYSRNKMEVFGNTSQVTYEGKNLWGGFEYSRSNNGVDFAHNTDGSITVNGTATSLAASILKTTVDTNNWYKKLSPGTYSFSGGESANIKLQIYDDTGTVIAENGSGSSTLITLTEETNVYIRATIANGTTVDTTLYVQIEQGSKATDWEPYVGGQPAPNPDYPQDIHVVTGNNIIGVTGKNLFDINGTVIGSSQVDKYNNGFILTKASNRTVKFELDADAPAGTYTISYDTINYVHTGTANAFFVSLQDSQNNIIVNNVALNDTGASITAPDGFKRLYFFISSSQGDEATITIDNVQLEKGSTATSYEPYHHQDYSLNLGSLELCKIGNYQDTIFKNTPDSEYYDSSLVEGAWYKYEATDEYTFTGEETNITKSTTTNNIMFQARVLQDTIVRPENNNTIIDLFSNYFVKTTENAPFSQDIVAIGVTTSGTLNIGMGLDSEINTPTLFKEWATNKLIIRYPLATPRKVQITDTTLIAQLEAIYNHLALTKGINHITITPQDLAPYVTLNYMQDLPGKLNNLASRIELLEE